MFQGELSGGLPARWEQHWQGSSLADAIRFCDLDPLIKILDAHIRPGQRILEGGCGLGQYVVHYHRRGHQIVGVDFAHAPLGRLKRLEPAVPVVTADVAALPFPDRSIDVYISNGVVEHFEQGPREALAEAHRVLKDQGVFLVSVPDANPLRRWVYRRAVTLRRAGDGSLAAAVVKTESHGGEVGAPLGQAQFFQYCYREREFKEILRTSGFSVIKTAGYSVVHGLMDIPWVERLFARETRVDRQTPPRERHDASRWAWRASLRELAKRAIIAEDDRMILVAPLVRALKSLAPNMRMYVGQKSDRGRS